MQEDSRSRRKKSDRPRLEIRETAKYGIGDFASEEIVKGRVITILSGEVVSFDECVRRCLDGVESVDDPLQIGLWEYIDLDPFSRAFNHSCRPNAGLRKKSELFALETIRQGEEITYDYSATVGPNITEKIWAMPCLCGQKGCRKVLGNILTIPAATLARYQRFGALQDYIVEELNSLSSSRPKE